MTYRRPWCQLETLGFDVLPSNGDLTAAEVSLLQVDEREYRLKHAIEKVAHQYAWIIIDCPPSLNMLTLNALTAANSVLIPMQCEYYALEGLASLLETIEQVRSSINPGSRSKACYAPCTMAGTICPMQFPIN